MIKKLLLTAASVFGVFGYTQSTKADVINGTFEGNSLTGWNQAGLSSFTSGDHLVNGQAASGSFTTPVISGSFMAVISPDGSGNALNQQSLESILGLTPLSLNFENQLVVNGAAIYQDVAVGAGDSVSFKYSFTDQEFSDGFYRDYVFFSVTGGSLNNVVVLESNGFSPNSTIVTSTGVRNFSYLFANAGTYRLGFGGNNLGDGIVPPFLYIDDVAITPANINPNPVAVPVPASFVLMSIGAATLGAFRRFRSKKEVA